MKRYSTLSVAVGAIPGALPVLIGTVAHSGELTLLGFTLFMIQFLWQFPHFWSISYLSFADYDKANYKLLPKNTDGTIDKNLGAYSAVYALLIIPTVLFEFYAGDSIGIYSLIAVLALTVYYTYRSLKLQWSPSNITARQLMFSSFFYLPLVLIFYFIG